MSGKRTAHGKMAGFLEELAWRGLGHHQTPALAGRLGKGPITAYVGFDPTAPSLQVGNLVPVVLLEHLRRAGGTPIVVLGDGTGLIGDPSGKQTERPLLETDLLTQNVAAQERQFRSLLPGVKVLNNATWLGKLELVDFLREVGKHFTISLMLQKESVRARLDEGISFTEFSYMLLQAYDFWHLYRSQHCEMQMGASDQWGNITAGIELIRRRGGAAAHGVCAPPFPTPAGAARRQPGSADSAPRAGVRRHGVGAAGDREGPSGRAQGGVRRYGRGPRADHRAADPHRAAAVVPMGPREGAQARRSRCRRLGRR